MIEFLLRICLWADEGGSEKSPSLLVLFPKCSQFEVSGKAEAYFGVPFPEGLQHPLNHSTVPICFLNSKHFLEILLKFSLQSKSHLAKIVILVRGPVVLEDEAHVSYKPLHLGVTVLIQPFLDFIQPHGLLQALTRLSNIIIVWNLGKKGALRTAIDFQEEELTFQLFLRTHLPLQDLRFLTTLLAS